MKTSLAILTLLPIGIVAQAYARTDIDLNLNAVLPIVQQPVVQQPVYYAPAPAPVPVYYTPAPQPVVYEQPQPVVYEQPPAYYVPTAEPVWIDAPLQITYISGVPHNMHFWNGQWYDEAWIGPNHPYYRQVYDRQHKREYIEQRDRIAHEREPQDARNRDHADSRRPMENLEARHAETPRVESPRADRKSDVVSSKVPSTKAEAKPSTDNSDKKHDTN